MTSRVATSLVRAGPPLKRSRPDWTLPTKPLGGLGISYYVNYVKFQLTRIYRAYRDPLSHA